MSDLIASRSFMEMFGETESAPTTATIAVFILLILSVRGQLTTATDLNLAPVAISGTVASEKTQSYEDLSIEAVNFAGISNKDEIDYAALTAEVGRQEDGEESGRSFLCIPIPRMFYLELSKPLRPGERVGLTGDHGKLGSWDIDKSVEMLSRDESGLRWYLRLTLCAKKRLHYRYFRYYSDSHGRKRLTLWEGLQHPRIMERFEVIQPGGSDIFGNIYAKSLGGGVQQEPGWLRYEYAIEFKFVWSRHLKINANEANPDVDAEDALEFGLKFQVVKASPFATDITPEPGDKPIVEVAQYKMRKSQFRDQPARGVPYRESDVVVFRIIEPLGNRNAYQLQLISPTGRLIGVATITPGDLTSTEGVLRLPVLAASGAFQIGHIRLPYLVIAPWEGSPQLKLHASFHHYWPLNWPSLDIGRRLSYVDPDNWGNTIQSLLRIAAMKADMASVVVQVTKDYESVLWHDFGFLTVFASDQVPVHRDLFYVRIMDLTYRELRRRRVFVAQNGRRIEVTHFNVNANESVRVFPTLAEVFKAVPKSLGLIVELKWPQMLRNGRLEAGGESLDKNVYVDRVLDVTSRYGCGRPLIFTSSDADMGSLLRLKQTVFPFVFKRTVTRGQEPFKDLRTHSYEQAINYAQAENLLGTMHHVESFDDDRDSVADLLDLSYRLHQVTFIEGLRLGDSERIQKLRDAEVNGLIFDNIDESIMQRKRVAFFTASELLAVFERQCGVVIALTGNKTLTNVTTIRRSSMMKHDTSDDINIDNSSH